jgi:methyl-accepting chemotaxis protein
MVLNIMSKLENEYNRTKNLQSQMSQLKSIYIGGLLFNSAKGVIKDQPNDAKVKKSMESGLSKVNQFYQTLQKSNPKLASKIQPNVNAFNVAAKSIIDAIAQGKRLTDIQNKEALSAWRGLKKQIVAPLQPLKKEVKASQKRYKEHVSSAINQTILQSVILVIIMIIVSSLISRSINQSLNGFKTYLFGFFDFLSGRNSEVLALDLKSKDEIAEMASVVQQHVNETKAGIEQDRQLIAEVEDVIEKVNNGFYMYQVKGSAHNQGVESLKNTLNDMIEQTDGQLNAIIDALSAYGQSSFDYKIEDRDDLNGSFGTLAASTKLLGNNISELLSMLMIAGRTLQKDTKELLDYSSELATASNQQASALEESSATLEEISSTIRNNTSNISNMSNISNDIKESAQTGLNLATKTTESMDEIDKEVTQINEAITVIDQIAFQTNILSLNAAVEAATAGEAGKGFAVVAGEVRNLAARSAEAAKDIKQLVENALNKANEGKTIAEDMIDGYHQLNTKIGESVTIANDILTASQEQEGAIIQINESITNIDHDTQKNANTAYHVEELAQEVAELSNDLVNTASNTRYLKHAEEQVCDVELLQKTAKLKNDHIVFKTTNFRQLGENKHWQVTNHHSCALGKWIDEQEQGNKSYVNSSDWQELKNYHKEVHQGVQNYIDLDTQKASNDELIRTSSSIELATKGVFDGLNRIKAENCKG